MMSWREVLELFGPGSVALGVAYVIATVLMIGIRLRPRAWNRRIIRALDRILERESESICECGDPLDFRPSEYVGAGFGGLRWWCFPGRIQIMRTVRAVLADGYRIKLRARARGSRGRIIDRTVEFDVRRAA